MAGREEFHPLRLTPTHRRYNFMQRLLSSNQYRVARNMTLIAEDLHKVFATRHGSLTVLRGISLSLTRGDALAIMGPSGSGKSTLLHILGTLDRPTRGRLIVDDIDPLSLSERELADFRNTRIGFIFQDHHLLPQLTVLENVLIPTVVQQTASLNATESWARQLLERVGLSGRLDHRPAELSGGERQRVAIARALVNHPLLLLADEPTGNLDRANARVITRLLLDLNQQEQTILVAVTHSAEMAAAFPRRLEMRDGQLIEMER